MKAVDAAVPRDAHAAPTAFIFYYYLALDSHLRSLTRAKLRKKRNGARPAASQKSTFN